MIEPLFQFDAQPAELEQQPTPLEQPPTSDFHARVLAHYLEAPARSPFRDAIVSPKIAQRHGLRSWALAHQKAANE